MPDPFVIVGGGVAGVVVITIATRLLGKAKATSSAPKAKPRATDTVTSKAIEDHDYAAAAERVAKAGDLESAYDLYLLAQQPLQAAQIALGLGKPALAAELYEKAGDKARAVVAYRLAEMNGKAKELEAEIEAASATAPKVPGKLAGPVDRAEQAEMRWRTAVREAGHREDSKEYLAGIAQTAAEAWISAGDMKRAAELCREAGLIDFAVNLYVNALGEPGAAAELMVEQGDLKRAAELFELGGQKDRSLATWIAWSKTADDPLACMEDVKRLGDEATSKFFDAVMAARPIVPDNLDLHYRIAMAMEHDPTNAKAVVDRISALQPSYRDVGVRLAQLAEAIARLPPRIVTVGTAPDTAEHGGQVIVARLPGTDLRGGVERQSVPSSLLEDTGRPPSVARLRDVIGGRPADLANIEVYYRLGLALLARGKYAEAERAFNQVEDVSADYRDAWPRAKEIETWKQDAVRSITGGKSPVQVAKRYTLLGQIGRGEMAVVFRAHDDEAGSPVAIKLPTDDAAEDLAFLDGFARDARAAMALAHRNIVTIHGVGKASGRPLVCMELVEGVSIESVLEKEVRLPIPDALAIIQQVLAALDHAHRSHVIHRGIKPANLIQGPSGNVKVLDFGLGAPIDLADPGGSGTPWYMAPELLAGGTLDPRTDLFAVGASLFEMITGDVPFDGAERIDPPRPLRELLPSATASLEQLVARAMELEAEHRFSSAEEMLAAVRGLR
jgi:tetratricopeptide (TPR) repeat protein